MSKTIEIKNAGKCYGENWALKNLTLRLEGNTIYGLLGRNGAGKSTLLNLLSNRAFPTEGDITIDGSSVLENDRLQSKIFYVGEEMLIPDETKVGGYFKMTKNFYPGFDMDYALKLAGAYGLSTQKRLRGLSTGYKTIAKLIAALACDAEYLLLDEPVLGLDANHREQFYRDLLENYSDNPRTIIISTHLIEEVSGIIEQVVIIKDGELLLNQSAEEMRRMGYSVSGKAEDVDAFCREKKVLSIEALGGLKTACILGKHSAVPDNLQITPLDMQKLFVHMTGKGDRK